MESQPQNPEFRINPENSHPCGIHKQNLGPDKQNFRPKIIVIIFLSIIHNITGRKFHKQSPKALYMEAEKIT